MACKQLITIFLWHFLLQQELDTLKWKSLAEQKKLTENLEEMTGLRDEILQQKNELQVSDKFCLKWRVNN